MMAWFKIYTEEISKKGGLLPFVLGKEKRSAGALINRIKKTLAPKSKILEIGTGTGSIGALLIKYGFDVIGTLNYETPHSDFFPPAPNSLELSRF